MKRVCCAVIVLAFGQALFANNIPRGLSTVLGVKSHEELLSRIEQKSKSEKIQVASEPEKAELLYGSIFCLQSARAGLGKKLSAAAILRIRTVALSAHKDPELIVLAGWWLKTVGASEVIDDSKPDKETTSTTRTTQGNPIKVVHQVYSSAPKDTVIGEKLIERGTSMSPSGFFATLYRLSNQNVAPTEFERATRLLEDHKGNEAILLLKVLKGKKSPETLRVRFIEAWNKLDRRLLIVRVTQALEAK